jgi:hypothetical protein
VIEFEHFPKIIGKEINIEEMLQNSAKFVMKRLSIMGEGNMQLNACFPLLSIQWITCKDYGSLIRFLHINTSPRNFSTEKIYVP